jgi:hypothetical protein
MFTIGFEEQGWWTSRLATSIPASKSAQRPFFHIAVSKRVTEMIRDNFCAKPGGGWFRARRNASKAAATAQAARAW